MAVAIVNGDHEVASPSSRCAPAHSRSRSPSPRGLGGTGERLLRQPQRPGPYPTIARTGDLPADRGEPATVHLALTPRELIVARDPDATVLGGASRHGHDILAVPRRQLEGVERTDSGARLQAGGIDIDVRLSPSLTDELITLVELGRAP